MKVYIVTKYAFCEFRGIVLVTADKAEAEQFCKQKNKTSRECEYHVTAKQLKRGER